MASAVIPEIVSQHFDGASFLWLLRSRAVDAPHFGLDELAELDDRLEAHLDGLRLAGGQIDAAAAETMASPDPGVVFVLTVLALERADHIRLMALFELVAQNPKVRSGLTSAFGWTSAYHLKGTVEGLLNSPTALHRAVGVAACALHGVLSQAAVTRFVADTDPDVRLRVLRAVGELGLVVCHDVLRVHMRSAESHQFWAARSAVLLGDRGEALHVLRCFAACGNPFRRDALALSLLALSADAGRILLEPLAREATTTRLAIEGAGVAGDPICVRWLIRQMAVPELARAAGEAFTNITGVDLGVTRLDRTPPDNYRPGPTEDQSDDHVGMDEDEHLPWPDAAKIAAWWNANAARFRNGTRYLAGEPVSDARCRSVLGSGTQRQRATAALSLSLSSPGTAVFPWRAPGWRQRRALATGN
jgi:uncharacterized protein (TIGR02270 family)